MAALEDNRLLLTVSALLVRKPAVCSPRHFAALVMSPGSFRSARRPQTRWCSASRRPRLAQQGILEDCLVAVTGTSLGPDHNFLFKITSLIHITNPISLYRIISRYPMTAAIRTILAKLPAFPRFFRFLNFHGLYRVKNGISIEYGSVSIVRWLKRMGDATFILLRLSYLANGSRLDTGPRIEVRSR